MDNQGGEMKNCPVSTGENIYIPGWFVHPCPFEDVAQYKSMCAKERVTLENPTGCIWFAVYAPDNRMAGFAAIINSTKFTARFKSDYVFNEFRGQGAYSALFDFRMEFALQVKLKKVTAFCTPLSLPKYLKEGFTQKSMNKNGIAFVEKVL